jgi:hypothetical protein
VCREVVMINILLKQQRSPDMSKTIFLSHHVKDKQLADIVAYAVNATSLRQIKTWFSSDDRIDGGFNAGDNWYSEIHQKAQNSDILVALITQNSIDRPWLYYEAGLAKAFKKIVVPVCIGIKREDIKSPLRELQGYQLSDRNSFEDFLGRILQLVEFPLDKKNFKGVIQKSILNITNYKFEKIDAKNVDIEEILENIKSHFDQKINSLTFLNSSNPTKGKSNLNTETYSIKFKLQFPNDRREFITEIAESDTFQSVTNNIFFNFSDIMKPFTYLEKWVIIDGKTKNYLVIREIASRIPAKSVFLKNTDYLIKPLSKPYSATNSKLRIKRG